MIYAVRLEPGQTALVEVGRASRIPPEKPDDEVILQIEATSTGVVLVIDPRYHQALGGRT